MEEDPNGPMLAHEKRVGYRKIVEHAKRYITKEIPPSSDSSEDDYTLFLDEDVKDKLKALAAERFNAKKSRRDADVKKRLEEHLKRFRGVGLFKLGYDYTFDNLGDLVEVKREENQQQ